MKEKKIIDMVQDEDGIFRSPKESHDQPAPNYGERRPGTGPGWEPALWIFFGAVGLMWLVMSVSGC